MHYLERLIRRALAVPRDQEAALFDPFEQVAPWEPEASTSRETVKTVQTPAALPRADDRAPASPRPAQLDAAKASTLDAPHAAIPLMPPQQQAVTPPLPERVADAVEQASAQAPLRPEAPAAEVPLARADAFMHTLGIQRPAMEARVAASPTSTVQPPDAETASTQRPRARATPSAAEPTLLRPVAPRAHAPDTPAAVPRARTAATAPPRDPAAPAARRPAPAPQPERVVQTTVVLAPPSRRLDELAHSSGIARFGLNQW